jgi:prolyl-tRNA editing enzyme YbaK/EbsC (Cys-tRNA(Pro) deacylase)
MSTSTFDRIVAWLNQEEVSFRHVSHDPTFTSEESAKARGESVRVGGKALVVKVGDDFRLFVLSADRKFDSTAVKKHFSVKKTRFAEREELLELTGLAPGSVPPFGPPILSLPLFVDPSVTENEVIAFNAGSLTDSLILATADYLRVANPEILRFASQDAVG